jgi:hypothetical protein
MQKYCRLAENDHAGYLAEGLASRECAFKSLSQVALQQKRAARIEKLPFLFRNGTAILT